MDDLERLARGLHEWPKGAISHELIIPCGFALGASKTGEWALHSMAGVVVTEEQWQAKRDELSGKPKEWVNDWARYRMQLHLGTWIELSDHPDKDVERKVEIVGYGEALDSREGFRHGLEERVVEDKAVEWVDRFPVGTVCKYENYTMGEWRKGEVIAHYKNVIVIADCESGFEGVHKHQVRPIKSTKEKEKAIEEIQRYLDNRDDGDSIAVAMYKAIYEKIEV